MIEADKYNYPKHIAVIMDGNGRWAKKKGASRLFGHRNAIKAVRETSERCAELGIEYLTLFAFSTENWGRPKHEVEGLMTLLVHTINDELPTLQKNNIRLTTIGDIGHLPESAAKKLVNAKMETQSNTGLNLVLALNYSGKWDILEATKKIAQDVSKGRLLESEIDDDIFNAYLSTAGMPAPCMIIRTSGEKRISNFLLWQAAYSELYFTDKFWPDFRKKDLDEAIEAFQKRERRFGKISEQISV